MDPKEIFDINEYSAVTYEDIVAFAVAQLDCRYCTHFKSKDKMGYVTCDCLDKAKEEDIERGNSRLQKEFEKYGNFEILDYHEFGFDCNQFKG
jgi:hypothetical protein